MSDTTLTPVIFSETNKTIAGNDQVIELNEHSVDCIRLLLRNQGEVVSVEQMLEECWGKRRIVVSSGSVRQMIATLRKQLMQLGAAESAIITLPRRGYVLQPGSIATDTISETTAPPSHAAAPPEIPAVTVTTADTRQQDQEALPDPVLSAADELPAKAKPLWEPSRRTLIFALILSLCVSALVGYYRLSGYIHSVSYQPLASSDGRHYFIQQGFAPAQSPVAALTQLEKMQAWDASRYRYIYFNHGESETYLSAFLCERPLDDARPACVSLFIYRGDHG